MKSLISAGCRLILLRFLSVALTASSGCSFIGLRRPPSTPLEASAPIECTTSRQAPTTDFVVGLGSLTAGLLMVAHNDRCGPGGWCFKIAEGITHTAGAVAIGVGVLALASGVYGLDRTARCAQLQRWQVGCADGNGAACAALDGGPPVDAPYVPETPRRLAGEPADPD